MVIMTFRLPDANLRKLELLRTLLMSVLDNPPALVAGVSYSQLRTVIRAKNAVFMGLPTNWRARTAIHANSVTDWQVSDEAMAQGVLPRWTRY